MANSINPDETALICTFWNYSMQITLSLNLQLITAIIQVSKNLGSLQELSHVMRKSAFCICENKIQDQLRSNHTADQHLCFQYTDSTFPFSKSNVSSLQSSSVAVLTGLCPTWSEPQKTGFLMTLLNYPSILTLFINKLLSLSFYYIPIVLKGYTESCMRFHKECTITHYSICTVVENWLC